MEATILNFEKTIDNIVLSSPASQELALNKEIVPSVENLKDTEAENDN